MPGWPDCLSVSQSSRPPVLAHHRWLGASGTWGNSQLSQIKNFWGLMGSVHLYWIFFIPSCFSSTVCKAEESQFGRLFLWVWAVGLVSQRSGRSSDNRLLRKLTESTHPDTAQAKLPFTTWGHTSGDLNTWRAVEIATAFPPSLVTQIHLFLSMCGPCCRFSQAMLSRHNLHRTRTLCSQHRLKCRLS